MAVVIEFSGPVSALGLSTSANSASAQDMTFGLGPARPVSPIPALNPLAMVLLLAFLLLIAGWSLRVRRNRR